MHGEYRVPGGGLAAVDLEVADGGRLVRVAVSARGRGEVRLHGRAA